MPPFETPLTVAPLVRPVAEVWNAVAACACSCHAPARQTRPTIVRHAHQRCRGTGTAQAPIPGYPAALHRAHGHSDGTSTLGLLYPVRCRNLARSAGPDRAPLRLTHR